MIIKHIELFIKYEFTLIQLQKFLELDEIEFDYFIRDLSKVELSRLIQRAKSLVTWVPHDRLVKGRIDVRRKLFNLNINRSSLDPAMRGYCNRGKVPYNKLNHFLRTIVDHEKIPHFVLVYTLLSLGITNKMYCDFTKSRLHSTSYSEFDKTLNDLCKHYKLSRYP